VQFEEDGFVGRGETQGVFYLAGTAEGILEQVHAVAGETRRDISREELQRLQPGCRDRIQLVVLGLKTDK